MKTDSTTQDGKYIVGIGASAGGLEALQKFLSALPSNTGFPYIIVQHLSPDYKSLLSEILGKYTDMPVIQAEEDMDVEPNKVYIIQPGKNMRIQKGKLKLVDQIPKELNLPIDIFFRSLAEEAGQHAIAIILSGTGSDGTNGLKAIKENEGMVIVQDLDTSKFDGMPRSAMRTGLVDAQISPEEIAMELQHIAGSPISSAHGRTAQDIDNELMKKVYMILKKVSNVNFTHYKQTTILRRMERRMMITHKDKLSDYVDFLQESAEEVRILSKEVLIGVTSFFRDPDFFQVLKEKVITDIVAHHMSEEAIRVWVAGCSTGEEAYSIAIMFSEVMDALKVRHNIKIFATDLDTEAISTAGKGVYGDNIVDAVSPARLSKFFTRRSNTYVVNRDIRKMIVFSPHNVFQDPPFGRLDLVSCRNMLIYFQPVLQNDLFAIFHQALNDNGYLFLGKSEAIGSYTDAFPVVDAAAKIFTHSSDAKIPGAKKVPYLQTTYLDDEFGAEVDAGFGYVPAKGDRQGDIGAVVIDNAVLEQFMPACVVINEKNELVHPASMDSLIFNSYVGSACIYEYHDGNIEILRATDKYAHMLGAENMTVDGLLKLDLMKYLDKKTAADVMKQVDAAAGGKEEITCELLFLDLPGCPHETYIRSTMRVIASAGDRCLIYCISDNITAQRVLERKERKISRQLQVVMDNVNCGITAVTVKDEGVEFLLANDKYYELLGYTKEQYHKEAGDSAFVAVCAEDKERTDRIIRHARETEKPTSLEYRAVRRDGSIVWLRSFLSVITFEDIEGQVQICTYADITAEKHTAQNLLDNLPCGVGICVISENDAQMTYLNKRYLTYFKHSTGMRNSSSVFSVIHPDDREMLRKAMLPALGKGGEGTCVIRVMDGPDEYISFRISGVAIASSGNDNAIYVTFVPISHEELSFSEMLPVALEKVMASSSEFSFVKDKELRYICCSKVFAHMVGLESEKDIVGKTDYDIFDKPLADKYVADDRKLMADGKSIINMVESIPTEGERAKYSSTSKYLLYDSLGNVIGLYGTGHDITHTREAESQQRFLINSIPGGVAVYEGKWDTLASIKLTYFSDGFCRIFGYTRDEYEKLSSKDPTGLIAQEDIPGLIRQIEALIKEDTPIDYIYKARTKGESYRWIHIKAVKGEQHGENMTVNAVLFDVTEHQEALERLRVSEEENRLAINHSKNVVCRYDVAKMSLKISSRVNPIFEMDSTAVDVPYGQVKNGSVSQDTAAAYTEFYEKIMRGEKNGSIVYQRRSTLGWRWIRAHSSTIFSRAGKPVSAVISFADVTDSLEKDIAYKKWMQSLHNKEPESYSLFRCNISKKTVFDTSEGSLLYIKFAPGPFSFDKHTDEYIDKCVHEADKERFRAFLNVDMLLEKYYRGERILTMEYREKLPSGGYRWLRLTADLVEYPHSADVEAYLLFEDIDDVKRNELLTIERAETDPLTGIYNRATFAEKVNERLKNSPPGEQHALLMLDIDGFKLVNDAFGHSAGDQALIDIANLLRTILRRDDMLGRLGGDEFVVFMSNIPEEKIAANKAKQICELTRISFSAEVKISSSVGIAVYPHDGMSFDALYKKADETLYYVKGSGKDDFALYNEGMEGERIQIEKPALGSAVSRIGEKKRRMLIVDDNKIDYELLANIFCSEFIIEKAKDGNAALIRMRHYGSAISVVLLDLMMPGIDGFEVLEKMQQSPEMCSIPVIVVSGADDRETSLRAIRSGACDFVMKPVDADVLRIRVQSAISKAENERLRAKNSCLEMQSAETLRYRAVLERLGVAVAEIDWGRGTFSYSRSVSEYMAGKYDGRSLWHILLTDLVTDAVTVKNIQQLVHDVADDRDRTQGSMMARLKTPAGKPHMFCVNVYKLINEFGLTNKMLLTFKDMDL